MRNKRALPTRKERKRRMKRRLMRGEGRNMVASVWL